MSSDSISNNKNRNLNIINKNHKIKSSNSLNNNIEVKKSILENIKSKFILKRIIKNLQKLKLFELIKCNKSIQNSLKMNINSYKEFHETNTPIEIEIIPVEKFYGKFINIEENGDMLYYHIYFNDSNDEIKRNSFSYKNENVSKIKVIIEHEIKSFS